MLILYVTIAILMLIVLGVAVHVFRSTANFFPDIYVSGGKNPARDHAINDMLSANYGFWDMVAGTEYDQEGFYEFFSRKNLRISCTHTTAVGLAVLSSIDGLWLFFTTTVDAAPLWLWNLFVYRVQNAEWF
jgi:hypothetical protein